MSKIETVRYVSWPRDQVRTLLPGIKWEATQWGIRFHPTKTSVVMIPWSGVIDITGIDSALDTPPTKQLIKP